MELTRSFRDAFGWRSSDESRKEELELGRKEMTVNQSLLLQLLGSVEKEAFAGAVKLVKAIFLIQSEATHKNIDSFSYSFYRWDYGPFDSSIYRDLEELRLKNLISITVEQDSAYPEKTYKLTSKGRKELQQLDVNAPLNTIIKKWTNKVNSMRRDEVLQFVYEKSNVKSYEMGDKVKLPDVK